MGDLAGNNSKVIMLVQASGLAWKAPAKFGFDLKNLGTNIDNLAEDFKVLCSCGQPHMRQVPCSQHKPMASLHGLLPAACRRLGKALLP